MYITIKFSTEYIEVFCIKSKYFVHIKVSAIIREKLHLSQKDYLRLIDTGKIRSISDLDLHKCRLKNGITLVFNTDKSYC